MKRQQSQGVTLMIVLIFLQILTTLSLYAFEHVVMTRRLIDDDWRYTMREDRDRYLLTHLEQRCLSQIPSCLLPVTPSTVLMKQTDAWWEAHACSGNFLGIRYHYAVEFLGVDPCARMKSLVLTDDHLTAAYYRFSLVTWHGAITQRRLQQSTLVKAVPASGVCDGKLRDVHLGRQSWRMLE